MSVSITESVLYTRHEYEMWSVNENGEPAYRMTNKFKTPELAQTAMTYGILL